MLLLLFFVFLLSISLCCDSILSCGSEQEALDLFSQTDALDALCNKEWVYQSISSSWWKLGNELVLRCMKEEKDISGLFATAFNEKKHKFNLLQTIINKYKRQFDTITPAFQWAEGLDEVALNIKMAHKWDTPATLECDDIEVVFNETSIDVDAKCPTTNKHFKLIAPLYSSIDPSKCTWSRAAVSRIVVTLVKARREKWPMFYATSLSMARNVHRWYEMQKQIDERDEKKLKEEGVEQRLKEREIEKKKQEEEYRYMEERKKRNTKKA